MSRVRITSVEAPLLAAAIMLAAATSVLAQELEPRRYVNTPIGLNFAALGYGFSTGNVLLDPSLPIEDLDSKLHVFAVRYVRSVNLFGTNGRIRAVLPMSAGDWTGKLDGVPGERSINGAGDLRVGIDVNFLGAPALKASEFGSYDKRTVAGFGLQIGVPVGQYNPDRLINLSNHRWTFIPSLGISHAVGKWTFEATGSVWLFTANGDFFGGNRLEQRPIATLQFHGVYTFRPGLWLGGGVGLANGGRTVVNGSPRDTYQQNSRIGLVFAYPLSRLQGLVVTYGTSLTTTSGIDFDAFGLVYQRGWGGAR